MSLTRRTLLRNAGFLTAGAALAGTSASSQVQQPLEGGLGHPKKFRGVRIIFAGSWLFCAGPHGAGKPPQSMLAIALDLSPTRPMHRFPYGAWGGSGFDSPVGMLASNFGSNPYGVHIPNYTAGEGINKIFWTASQSSSFTYLGNGKNKTNSPKYEVDLTKPGSRIISLPIPSDIVPAAFLTTARVTDNCGDLQTASYARGVPTVHILNYPAPLSTKEVLVELYGPDGVCLDTAHPMSAERMGVAHGEAEYVHYHFHTVPLSHTNHTGVDTFNNLQTLIQCNPNRAAGNPLLILEGADDGEVFPGLPKNMGDVQREELDIPPQVHHVTTASCTGGGLGLGCSCDACAC